MSGMNVNLKEQNAKYTFQILIRDIEHFYRIVAWLNQNVGHGMKNWTMAGKIKKQLMQSKQVNTKVYIFADSFDESASTYLSLI